MGENKLSHGNERAMSANLEGVSLDTKLLKLSS